MRARATASTAPICPARSRSTTRCPTGPLVVYCWSPACNGATKAAARLHDEGRAVREMLGGFEYWVREGLPIEGAVGGDRLVGP